MNQIWLVVVLVMIIQINNIRLRMNPYEFRIIGPLSEKNKEGLREKNNVSLKFEQKKVVVVVYFFHSFILKAKTGGLFLSLKKRTTTTLIKKDKRRNTRYQFPSKAKKSHFSIGRKTFFLLQEFLKSKSFPK